MVVQLYACTNVSYNHPQEVSRLEVTCTSTRPRVGFLHLEVTFWSDKYRVLARHSTIARHLPASVTDTRSEGGAALSLQCDPGPLGQQASKVWIHRAGVRVLICPMHDGDAVYVRPFDSTWQGWGGRNTQPHSTKTKPHKKVSLFSKTVSANDSPFCGTRLRIEAHQRKARFIRYWGRCPSLVNHLA